MTPMPTPTTTQHDLDNATKNVRAVAIFDLDGTLTTRSTFLPYLIWWGLRNRRFSALCLLPFRLAAYVAGLVKDSVLKEQLMVSFLGGVSQEQLKKHTEWFCKSWLPRHVHPVGMEHLEQHRRRGDRIILLSASPDIYVTAVGDALGIHEIICTQVTLQNGNCVGTIRGENCKGPAKLTRITELLGDNSSAESFAYGDSRHDLPILSWATEGRLIRRNRSDLVTSKT